MNNSRNRWNLGWARRDDRNNSIYNILKRANPYFTRDLDELVLASKEGLGEAVIVTEGREYKVHINPFVTRVKESDVPAYIKKRIKKTNK
jgi:hypothetical protein